MQLHHTPETYLRYVVFWCSSSTDKYTRYHNIWHYRCFYSFLDSKVSTLCPLPLVSYFFVHFVLLFSLLKNSFYMCIANTFFFFFDFYYSYHLGYSWLENVLVSLEARKTRKKPRIRRGLCHRWLRSVA